MPDPAWIYVNVIILHTRAVQWLELREKAQIAVGAATRSSMALGKEIANALTPFLEVGRLETLEDVRAFRAIAEPYIIQCARLRNEGSSDAASLFQYLHGSIDQVMRGAAAGLDGMEDGLSDLVADLDRVAPEDARLLAAALEACRSASVSPAEMQKLADLLQILKEKLAPAPQASTSRPAPPTRTKNFEIAIIEDELSWQTISKAAVQIAAKKLGPAFTLTPREFDTADEARQALVRTPSTPPQSAQAKLVQTIAIIDMGLPRDVAHKEAIRRNKRAPESATDRNVGQQLLADLRGYTTNIPCIVLTQAPHLKDDQIKACSNGVRDSHYVLKELSTERLQELADRIRDICTVAQAHRVEVFRHPSYYAAVDGVVIPQSDVATPLTELPFRTFYALCKLSQESSGWYSIDEILDTLQQEFGEVFQYLADPVNRWEEAQVLAAQRGRNCWSADKLRPVANIIHLWASSREQSAEPEDLDGALAHFVQNYKRLYDQAISLSKDYLEAHPEIVGTLPLPAEANAAARMERVFGGLASADKADYKTESVQDHIVTIRKAIQQAFNAVHQHVYPHRLIAHKSQSGYRVVAEIATDLDKESPDLAGEVLPLRVLVVENETKWSEPITALLKSTGFEVKIATNTDEAVEQALEWLPDILSLDMHIPSTREEWELKPEGGHEDGGLRALARIRQVLPNIAVICPTTLYNNDELRFQAATHLDVPATAFVPKGETGWEGQLLLAMNRLAHKVRTGHILPPATVSSLPIVRVLPGTDFEQGALKLDVGGVICGCRACPMGKLLGVFLQHPETFLTWSDLEEMLSTSITEDDRKNWSKRSRNIIKEWPLNGEPAGKSGAESILQTVEAGLILHAHVVDTRE